MAFPLATYAENLLIMAEAGTRVNGLAAGLSRLNAFRSYMNTGGYIGATYFATGNYKYDAYVAVVQPNTGAQFPNAFVSTSGS